MIRLMRVGGESGAAPSRLRMEFKKLISSGLCSSEGTSPFSLLKRCLPQLKIETNRDVISRVLGAQISCNLVHPNAL